MSTLEDLLNKHCPKPTYAPRPDRVTSKRILEESEAKAKAAEALEKRKKAKAEKGTLRFSSGQNPEQGDEDFPREPLDPNRLTMDRIVVTVAEIGKIKVSQILSTAKPNSIARPRQVAMYLSYRLIKGMGYAMVGRRFKRDHTTVKHAVRKIEDLIEIQDQETTYLVHETCKKLELDVPPLPEKTEEQPPP